MKVSHSIRLGISTIWLGTGLLVAHPYYRAVGAVYLGQLGLPAWLMYPVCAAELALGIRVAVKPLGDAVAALQVAMIAGFTVVLTWMDPMLLVDPFGMLTKNIPILAMIGAVWLVEREGWTPRAVWVLRAGMAVVWITEGLLPKMLFQQPMELAVVASSGLVPGDPGVFLWWMGLAQVVSGVAALVLRGLPLVALLYGQTAALFALPLLVGSIVPLLWVHPFGPLTKTIPIFVGTLMLAQVMRPGGTQEAER